jgi:uncharacterized membrane protein YfcA
MIEDSQNKIPTNLAQHSKIASVVRKNYIWIYSLSISIVISFIFLVSLFFPLIHFGNNVVDLSNLFDKSIFIYILIGFLAQMIDGALGMAYGVISNTFLLSFGIYPLTASASVHVSEIFTSGFSGLSHFKFGNFNAKLFKSLLIPGIIGAVFGAYILSSFQNYNHFIKPAISTYTLVLGFIILVKAMKKVNIRQKIKRLFPLAFMGGFLDSLGGGGWGPIVSSTLIANGKNPKHTIGSVNLAEFFVTIASSLTFITLIGVTNLQIIFGLIFGGIIASPISAFLVNKIPIKTLMILVGLLIITISLKGLFFY